MSRISTILIASVLVAGSAHAQPTAGESRPEAARDEVNRAVALLERLDTTLITLDFQERPLAAVIESIGDLAALPLQVDWQALDMIGVGRSDRPFANAVSATNLRAASPSGRAARASGFRSPRDLCRQ